MEILALVLIVAVVGWILLPVLRGRTAPLEGSEDLPEEESRKRVALKALRDVEYDYRSGKLDEEDYARLRTTLSREALHALERAERGREVGTVGAAAEETAPREGREPEADGAAVEDGTAAAVEVEVRRLREALREGTLCRGCGTANRTGSRFCGGCGLPLAAGVAEPGGGA